MLHFRCPGCRELYHAEDSYLGTKVSCDKCKTRFYIPANGAEAVFAPPKRVFRDVPPIPVPPPETLLTPSGVSIAFLPDSPVPRDLGKAAPSVPKLLSALCLIFAVVAVASTAAFFSASGRNKEQSAENMQLQQEKTSVEESARRWEAAAGRYQSDLRQERTEYERKIAALQQKIETLEAKVKQLEQAPPPPKEEERKPSAAIPESPERRAMIEKLTRRLSELEQSLAETQSRRSECKAKERQAADELARVTEDLQRDDYRCYEFCIVQAKIQFRRVMRKERAQKAQGYFETRYGVSRVDPDSHLWKKVDVKYVCTFHNQEWTQERADKYRKTFRSANDLKRQEMTLKNALSRIQKDYSKGNFEQRIIQLSAEIAKTKQALAEAERGGGN